jgi:hypothetical protein
VNPRIGAPFLANPRLTIGRREIGSYDGGIRNGREAIFFGASL